MFYTKWEPYNYCLKIFREPNFTLRRLFFFFFQLIHEVSMWSRHMPEFLQILIYLFTEL